MINRFIALDFETSIGNNPCSIGIAEFENGKLVNSYYSLIKPKDLKFNPYAQRVHGISLSDVINEREFPEIWNEVCYLFEGELIVAHSYGTEKAILNNCFNEYNISKIDIEFDCTLKMSRKYLDIDNHKLSTVAGFFNIEQKNYHNALDDAIVCGKIFLELNKYSYTHNVLKPKSNIVSSKKRDISFLFKQKENVHRDENFKTKVLKLKSTKLEGEKFVITGVFQKFYREELKQSIEDNGGKVGSSISKKTSYVIAGDNMGPSKLKKAESLNIPIISETDYLELIS